MDVRSRVSGTSRDEVRSVLDGRFLFCQTFTIARPRIVRRCSRSPAWPGTVVLINASLFGIVASIEGFESASICLLVSSPDGRELTACHWLCHLPLSSFAPDMISQLPIATMSRTCPMIRLRCHEKPRVRLPADLVSYTCLIIN